MGKYTHWWAFLFLLLSVIASTALTFSIDLQQVHHRADLEYNPDAFATEVHAIDMDEKGSPKAILDSQQLVHYPHDNTTFLTSPELTIYHKNQEPWIITCSKGQMINGAREIYLQDNVKLHQTSGPYNHELTILTDGATFYPEQQYATSKLPVRMLGPGTELSSTGVDVHMREGTVELLTQARGIYAKTVS